jgi:hypothetical protein
VRAALAAALACAVACGPQGGAEMGGTVSVDWRVPGPPTPPARPARTGEAGGKPPPPSPVKPDTSGRGAMRGAGSVVWCAEPRLALVTAAQGDTGLGLVLHLRDSLGPATLPVVLPGDVRAPAPRAAVALRLLSRTAVEGYQADSGSVTLTAFKGERLSGRLRASAHAVNALGLLRMEGEFADLPVRRGGAGCPPR